MAMYNTSHLCGVILAAGKGTRMGSPLPKVLISVAGKPMLSRVLEAMRSAVARVCVVTHELTPEFQAVLAPYGSSVGVCLQKERNGTGGAAAASAPYFQGVRAPSYVLSPSLVQGFPLVGEHHVLICPGDAPVLSGRLLQDFVQASLAQGADLAVLGMRVPHPTGYGRLVLSHTGQLLRIVEEKDATEDEKAIDVCNAGVYLAKSSLLFPLLCALDPLNAQKEYYFTDCIAMAVAQGYRVHATWTDQWQELMGVNDPTQLAQAEACLKLLHKDKASS